MAVVDHDRTMASRRLTDRVAASPYFTLVARPAAYAGALRLVEDDRADIVLTIPTGYGRDLGAGLVDQPALPAIPRHPDGAHVVEVLHPQVDAARAHRLREAVFMNKVVEAWLYIEKQALLASRKDT